MLFIKKHVSSLGAMIHFSLSIRKYDELIKQYKTTLVDCINLTMNKAKALGTVAPIQNEIDKVSANNLFSKDQMSKIQTLDDQRKNLTAGAKILHTWMAETLDELLLHNLRRLLAPDIKAIITKRIRIASVKNLKDSWKSLSAWMRKQPKGISPRYMLEPLTSMMRLSNMLVVF